MTTATELDKVVTYSVELLSIKSKSLDHVKLQGHVTN